MAAEFPIVFALYPHVTQLDFTGPHEVLARLPGATCILASSTGGQYFREEDLHKLPDTISAKTERVQSPMEVELWASPLYFLLMLGVVTAEWVLRKMSHLK